MEYGVKYCLKKTIEMLCNLRFTFGFNFSYWSSFWKGWEVKFVCWKFDIDGNFDLFELGKAKTWEPRLLEDWFSQTFTLINVMAAINKARDRSKGIFKHFYQASRKRLEKHSPKSSGKSFHSMCVKSGLFSGRYNKKVIVWPFCLYTKCI